MAPVVEFINKTGGTTRMLYNEGERVSPLTTLTGWLTEAEAQSIRNLNPGVPDHILAQQEIARHKEANKPVEIHDPELEPGDLWVNPQTGHLSS